MSSYPTDKFREILLDRQRFEELARSFIKESSDVHASESDDPKFGEYLKVGLDLLLKENLEFVFKFTESPIETIFVNSLVLAFIKGDPLNLVVQHSVKNAPGQIEAFRKRRANFKEFITWYETKNGSIAGVDEYLHQELARGKMEAGEHHYLWRHLIFYEWFGLEDRFHMILQPGLPNVRVEGRAVRPDLLFWIPSDESIKIIVECDGFQYHKEKAAFVHDRKRDRVLKASGYEVLRYSGTEIYADPIAAGADLAEYLWSKE